ncbi:MAG: bifunctional chorismate mutase/prephenate dehydrogenase [Gammaproteobacteria bacterium]|nr:bifunctional chorismate mutase/prephenate dehydrogenase [Gammaproteobacteria bacterium]
MESPKQITIVGGNGQMGQLFAGLLQSLGHKIKLLDKADWAEALSLLAGADLVLITVPINETKAIIHKLQPFLSPQSILADLTSLQANPLKSMLEVHAGPVLGLHPMFGPSISAPHNQGIIYSEGRAPDECLWLLQDLEKLGFTLQAMSADTHDKMMNFVQGLEHFNTIALGRFLQEQAIDVEALNKLASPIYHIKLLLLGRIFDQDPGLYADILMADDSRVELIAGYLQAAQGLHTLLKASDRNEIIEQFNEVKAYLGGFTKFGQKESDTLLDLYYLNKKDT